MRAAVLALLLLAVLLCTGVEAAGAPVRRLARSPTVAPEVGLTPKEICVAKCAAESAVCVYKCEHPGMLGGCKENCAITAAECAAECAFEAEAPVATMVVPESAFAGHVQKEKTAAPVATTVVPESAFAGLVAAAEKELVATTVVPESAFVKAPASSDINGQCMVKCAADAAYCAYECFHQNSTSKVVCDEKCAAEAAECAGTCVDPAQVSAAVEKIVVLAKMANGIVSEEVAVAMQAFADKTQFAAFKIQYGKSYASPALEAHRFELFQANLRSAEELSQRVPTATFGVTPFMDLHPTEFARSHRNFRPAVGASALLRMNVPTTAFDANITIPSSFDWRKPGNNRPPAVTAVKDQGQCGSCWAFSATEALESATILAGKNVILAPEQTVDCDTTDAGCNGGDTVSAYAYMKQAGGVVSEASYPYTAGVTGAASTCAFKKADVKASLKGFTYATPTCSDECKTQDEALLAANLYHNGPVSICVDASPWQLYLGGVLTSDSGCGSAYTSLDHCVQLVGYGVDATSGQKYWSVRNSWAAIWGEAGYIRLAYGANTCGVADEATQVTV